MRDLLFWESENFKKYIQIYFQLSCGEFFKIALPNPLIDIAIPMSESESVNRTW